MKITRTKLKLLEISDNVAGIISYEHINNNRITIGRQDIETCIEFEPADIPALAQCIVKMCGKLNNEGQQHIRTNKDKENQKIVDCLNTWVQNEPIIKHHNDSKPTHDELKIRRGAVLHLNNLIRKATGKDIQEIHSMDMENKH